METKLTAEQIKELRKLGYKVKETGFGWSCVNPMGYSIIRGWTKTEEEAWIWCKRDHESKL